MSLSDDLATMATDLSTLQAEVQKAADAVSLPANPSVGDQVLEAVLPVLEAAGYTVTAPEVESPAEDAGTGEESDAASTDQPSN